MSNYENYRIGTANNYKTISDILEDSANRESSDSAMRGILIGGYCDGDSYNSEFLKFATYKSSVHPFKVNTNLNDYFGLNNILYSIYVNRNYIHKGGAPLLNDHYVSSYSQTETITYTYRNSNGGDPFSTGILTRSGGTSVSFDYYCPSSIVVAVIGSGGGGAGGCDWWSSKISCGGGCGPLLLLNVEMPYLSTNDTDVLRIELGEGGKGGGQNSAGFDGKDTKVYFKYQGEWTLIATLQGGKGGKIYPYNSAFAPTTDLAITGITFNQPINTVTLSNGNGYGKVTINISCRSFSWGSGTYAYMPGDYYDFSIDDSYRQSDYTSKKVTSSTDNNLAYLSANFISDDEYYTKSTATYTSRMYSGRHSIFSNAGKYPTNGSGNGNNGYLGSGGGAGGAAINAFNAGSKGGKGGDAAVKIYY